jgi:hypothetical protein
MERNFVIGHVEGYDIMGTIIGIIIILATFT